MNFFSISFTGGGLDGKYNFAQFHFHWGSETENGAEHTFNGNRHFAEVHLVHWKVTKTLYNFVYKIYIEIL